MNQHDYVKECLAFYEEGGWSPEKGWEQAHYPAPDGTGDATIWMLHDHHQVQGLWQSKEYGQCCFFVGHAKQFLTEGPFVSGWFELWDIYDEYSGENGRKTAELGVGIHAPGVRSKGGTKSAELGLGIHAPGMQSKGGTKTAELGVGIHAPGMQSEGGKTQPREAKMKGGTRAAELGVGIHAPGMQSKGGKEGSKTTNSQKWQSTDPNHPPHVSTAAGLTRWQKARGIDTSMRVKLA
jgi:hypothetical protein